MLAAAAAPSPPPISFPYFLQLVDVQFLDHVRRGTSINMVDLAADPPPRTLAECLQLTALAAPEVGAFEGAITRLQRDIQAKRAALVESENRMAEANPAVFRSMQVSRRSNRTNTVLTLSWCTCLRAQTKRLCAVLHALVAWYLAKVIAPPPNACLDGCNTPHIIRTLAFLLYYPWFSAPAPQEASPGQSDQLKHALVVLKKVCRAATMTRWKQLRLAMETGLGGRIQERADEVKDHGRIMQVRSSSSAAIHHSTLGVASDHKLAGTMDQIMPPPGLTTVMSVSFGVHGLT